MIKILNVESKDGYYIVHSIDGDELTISEIPKDKISKEVSKELENLIK